MTSLLDIGPLTEEVEVRGVKLEVQGLTAGHIFQLFAEFPDMRKLLDSKQGNAQEVMLTLAPDLIAKIIAMAVGKPRQQGGRGEGQDDGSRRSDDDPRGGAAAVVPRRHRPFRGSGDRAHDVASTGLPAKGSSPHSIELDDQVACAIQRLIANGHTRRDAWACTPRQLIAWCESDRAGADARDGAGVHQHAQCRHQGRGGSRLSSRAAIAGRYGAGIK